MATERQVEMLTENSPEARVYRLRKLHLQAVERNREARRDLKLRPDCYLAKCRESRTRKALRILFDKLTLEQRGWE